MRKEVTLSYLTILFHIKIIYAKPSDSVMVPILQETLTKHGLNVTRNFKNTEILRYGHHDTQHCKNFTSAYRCIMTCLEKGFEIAKADKKCKCTCSADKTKAAYIPITVEKGWTVPTTTVPIWATTKSVQINKLSGHHEDNDEQEHIEGSGHGHLSHESDVKETSEEVTGSEEEITTENASVEKKDDLNSDKETTNEENQSEEKEQSPVATEDDVSNAKTEENHFTAEEADEMTAAAEEEEGENEPNADGEEELIVETEEEQEPVEKEPLAAEGQEPEAVEMPEKK